MPKLCKSILILGAIHSVDLATCMMKKQSDSENGFGLYFSKKIKTECRQYRELGNQARTDQLNVNLFLIGSCNSSRSSRNPSASCNPKLLTYLSYSHNGGLLSRIIFSFNICYKSSSHLDSIRHLERSRCFYCRHIRLFFVWAKFIVASHLWLIFDSNWCRHSKCF